MIEFDCPTAFKSNAVRTNLEHRETLRHQYDGRIFNTMSKMNTMLPTHMGLAMMALASMKIRRHEIRLCQVFPLTPCINRFDYSPNGECSKDCTFANAFKTLHQHQGKHR